MKRYIMRDSIKLIVKLKSKTLSFELDSEKQIDEFYKVLETNDIVKFGPIIFKRDDFVFAEVKIKETFIKS